MIGKEEMKKKTEYAKEKKKFIKLRNYQRIRQKDRTRLVYLKLTEREREKF
jgi:hypothetical protein